MATRVAAVKPGLLGVTGLYAAVLGTAAAVAPDGPGLLRRVRHRDASFTVDTNEGVTQVRDYEVRLDVFDTMIHLSMGALLLRRVAHPST